MRSVCLPPAGDDGEVCVHLNILILITYIYGRCMERMDDHEDLRPLNIRSLAELLIHSFIH